MVFSSPTSDPGQPQPGPKNFRNAGIYRLACRMLVAWTCILVLAAVTALTIHWLKQGSQPEQAAETPAAVAEQHSSPKSPQNSFDSTEDVLGAIKPRTVEQMLNEDTSDIDINLPALPDPPSISGYANAGGGSTHADHDIEHLSDSTVADMPDELTTLLKEARYAQIEGDMRRSIIKLEQASEIAPDNPVLAYYFGLAYEFLRNAPKSREYFAKVVTQREKAGKYYQLAAMHLERGFNSPADRRGDMSFGTILEYHEPNLGDGERVVLTIPIMMKDGINIRPEDLWIPIHFFDAVNGKSIDFTRAEKPEVRWVSEPVDWAEGEEILEVRYYMPPLTNEELTAYGDLKYYGYTAKLYYKGEPMDCRSNPPVLFLIEQMKQNKPTLPGGFDDYGDSLLPPVDAIPMSDSPGTSPYYAQPDADAGLLPP